MTTGTDWDRLATQTDEEIVVAAMDDPDSFIPDDDFWKKANITPPRKQTITIRLDSDILDFFKGKNAKGYQQRINGALRAFMDIKRADCQT